LRGGLFELRLLKKIVKTLDIGGGGVYNYRTKIRRKKPFPSTG
jgi:hypothetical protein